MLAAFKTVRQVAPAAAAVWRAGVMEEAAARSQSARPDATEAEVLASG